MASGFCGPPDKAMDTVSGPTRPRNMVREISSLETTLRVGVMPVVSPTVAKADTVSYSTSARVSSAPATPSTALITTVSNSTRVSASVKIASAGGLAARSGGRR